MTLPGNLAEAIKQSLPLCRGWGDKPMRPYRMAELILKEKPKVVVEVGVFGAQSLLPQAFALKMLGEGKIYGIDPYSIEVVEEGLSDLDCPLEWWVRQDMSKVLLDTHKLIQECGVRHHVVLLIGESIDCSTLFGSIDILHIDGAHSEKGVLLDVNLYAKRVKKGGYIWMDDTHLPSLEKALHELEHFAVMTADYGGYRLYQVA